MGLRGLFASVFSHQYLKMNFCAESRKKWSDETHIRFSIPRDSVPVYYFDLAGTRLTSPRTAHPGSASAALRLGGGGGYRKKSIVRAGGRLLSTPPPRIRYKHP